MKVNKFLKSTLAIALMSLSAVAFDASAKEQENPQAMAVYSDYIIAMENGVVTALTQSQNDSSTLNIVPLQPYGVSFSYETSGECNSSTGTMVVNGVVVDTTNSTGGYVCERLPTYLVDESMIFDILHHNKSIEINGSVFSAMGFTKAYLAVQSMN